MKKFFSYLKKVWKNQDAVYSKENELLKNSMVSFCISIAFIAFLVFPIGRLILKYSTLIFIAILAIMAFGSFVSDIHYLRKAYKYSRKLEKLGSSVEEEEMARKTLCELEGDDGLSPVKHEAID